MATKSYKILERRSVGSAALPKNDAREWIGHAVNARRHLGASEAMFQVARELGVTPRRIAAIMRNEVNDLWATEYLRIRDWYVRDCERHAAASAHHAAMARAAIFDIEGRLSK